MQTTGIKVETLIGLEPIKVNVALNEINVFDELNGYPVYIIDELLCRGLDIKTSPKIEESGGIYVIVAKVPSSTKVL